MRLTKGWGAVWDEDLVKFFTKCPLEFALFIFLLRKANFGDSYGLWIKGKQYNKWHDIPKGDALSSKEQIREIWGFHHATSRKHLDGLFKKGLVEILLEDPALIVRIKNYEYFSAACKPEDRPLYVHTPPSEVNTPSSHLHTPPSEVNTPSSHLSEMPHEFDPICSKVKTSNTKTKNNNDIKNTPPRREKGIEENFNTSLDLHEDTAEIIAYYEEKITKKRTLKKHILAFDLEYSVGDLSRMQVLAIIDDMSKDKDIIRTTVSPRRIFSYKQMFSATSSFKKSQKKKLQTGFDRGQGEMLAMSNPDAWQYYSILPVSSIEQALQDSVEDGLNRSNA